MITNPSIQRRNPSPWRCLHYQQAQPGAKSLNQINRQATLNPHKAEAAHSTLHSCGSHRNSLGGVTVVMWTCLPAIIAPGKPTQVIIFELYVPHFHDFYLWPQRCWCVTCHTSPHHPALQRRGGAAGFLERRFLLTFTRRRNMAREKTAW